MAETLEAMFSEPPPSLSGMSDDEIIREYIRLDSQIKEIAYQRKPFIDALLQKAADMRDGRGTVHLETSDRKLRVKVEFKKDHVFDPMEIECAKDLLGDERFGELFKTEYTPRLQNLKMFLSTRSSDERVETARATIQGTLQPKDKNPSIAVEKK